MAVVLIDSGDGLLGLRTVISRMACGAAPDADSRVSSATVSVVPDFATLFAEHVRYLWSTLRRLGIREGDLEDMAHEVMLRVHAQLAHRDLERPIRPWLFGLALGAAANYRRLARHRVELHPVPPEVQDPAMPTDEELIVEERRRWVHQALLEVPLQHRAVLILHDMDETPVPEIAAALGIGSNTAYSRLRLGREAFRKALEHVMAHGGAQ